MTEFEVCMVGIGFAFILIAIFKDPSEKEKIHLYLIPEKNKELRRLIEGTGKVCPPVFGKAKKKKDTSVKIPKRLRVKK